MQETPVRFLDQEIPWRRDRLPTPVFLGFPGGSAGKESACNAGDLGSIPGWGRPPEEGNDYSLQYSGLEKSTDCIVHGVANSQTGMSPNDILINVSAKTLFMLTSVLFPKKVDLPQRCSNAWRHLRLSQHEEMLWEPESQRPEMLLNTCKAHETALQWDSLALLLDSADGDPQVQIHQAKQATPVHGGWGCSGWKGEFCHHLSSAAACSSHRGWHVLTHPEGSLNHWWPQKPHCASPVQTQWEP